MNMSNSNNNKRNLKRYSSLKVGFYVVKWHSQFKWKRIPLHTFTSEWTSFNAAKHFSFSTQFGYGFSCRSTRNTCKHISSRRFVLHSLWAWKRKFLRSIEIGYLLEQKKTTTSNINWTTRSQILCIFIGLEFRSKPYTNHTEPQIQSNHHKTKAIAGK